jgi:hypothetical protein
MKLRRIIVNGAALSALALLSACGSGEDKPEGPQKLNSEQLVRKVGPTTVKLYGKWGDTMTAGSPQYHAEPETGVHPLPVGRKGRLQHLTTIDPGHRSKLSDPRF